MSTPCWMPVHMHLTGFWHAGERHALKGRVLNTSGLTFVASESDLDAFDLQVKETTRFLNENRDAFAVAVSFAGVEYTGLRFGIGVFGEFAARTHELPAEFVKAAADAGLCVRLCH